MKVEDAAHAPERYVVQQPTDEHPATRVKRPPMQH